MEPTDALFDAINRGDINAARDAISRGANLRGHNVLGMTPMELSVDLGRNDISFLLLSMRGADGYSASGTADGGEAPADEAGEAGPAAPGSAGGHVAGGHVGTGTLADGTPVQRRRRHSKPERRVPGVRRKPAMMAGNSSD